MHFVSTRGLSAPVQAPQAVLQGIAPDGGLYIPDEIPALLPQDMLHDDFFALAQRILLAYLPGYTQDEIQACVQRAYQSTFDAPDITPLRKVGNRHVLELFHGPTAAFKDVALSILPQLMRTALEKTPAHPDVFILTATSGDTGSAALTGFCNVPHVRVLVFYPEQGISDIQRAQMTTMQGNNVHVCAIHGNFDAAQSGVKSIFAAMPDDFCARQGFMLSSANSINIGRLVPQIVYYYHAYLQLVRSAAIRMGDPVDFSVPTGNFGDILAGYFAKLSGLPIGRLICCSNANRVLTDFFETGVYDRNRPFLITASPSMDILVSSNLERLLYLVLDRDAAAVRGLMEQLRTQGRYQLTPQAMQRINACFGCASISDAEGRAAIAQVYKQHGYIMDPHTAVAWQGATKAGAGSAPCVILSTASPAKFPACVLSALQQPVPQHAQAQLDTLCALGVTLPRALQGLLQRPVRFQDCIDPQDMMAYVQRKAAME